MYCDSTPSGKRISAPAMIGTDSIKPFCAGVRSKVSLMNGAIAPFSTQMAQREVEVEEGREQRRPVAGANEGLECRHAVCR